VCADDRNHLQHQGDRRSPRGGPGGSSRGRNLARTARGYLVLSVCIALLGGIGGLTISTQFLVPTGGAVVLAVSLLFFLTLAASAIRLRVSARRKQW